MKKLIYLLAIATVAFTACQKQPEPIAVDFAKDHYVLQADGSVELVVTMSRSDDKNLAFPINFGGTAEREKDYTASSDVVTVKAGEKSGSIVITAKDNFTEGKTIEVTFSLFPTGCVVGANEKAVIAVEAKETLIYSFSQAKSDVLDQAVLKVGISGKESGTSWVASDDFDLPFKAEGATDAVEFVENAIKVKKGLNYGTLTVKAKDVELGSSEAKVKVSVDAEKAGARFAAGTNASEELTVKGVLKISSILGTWNFGGTFGSDPTMEDEDCIENWFFMGDDDPELLPLKNEGFSLTFEEVKDEEGNVTGYKLVPGGTGDFNNFFRESAISWTSPIEGHITNQPDGCAISDYCTDEGSMFVMYYDENLDGNELLTWFGVKANRNFDAESENVADAAIAMRVNSEGQLIVHIKDYDQPPFGENWWYDPDMFCFASWFTKAE